MKSKNLEKIIEQVTNFSKHKVKKSFNFYKTFPLIYTSLLFGISSYITIPIMLKAEEPNYNYLSFVVLYTSFGVAGDLTRHILTKRKHKKWSNQNSDLAKVVGEDYFNGIINTIKKEDGFKGECERIELRCRQDGTSLSQEGYFYQVIFKFNKFQEKKLIFKYNSKPNIIVGQEVTNFLRKKGYNFFPKTYSYFNFKEDLLPGDFFFEPETQNNRGVFYEFIDSESLESLYINGDNLEIDKQNKHIENIVDEIFNNMHQVYKNDSIIKNKQEISVSFRIKDFRFQESLIKKLVKKPGNFISLNDSSQVNDESNFIKSYILAKNKELKDLPVSLIHGDIHQGNILIEKGNHKIHIIDLDNAEYGVPYQDFFHFAVISDYERHTSFQKKREEFIKKQTSYLGEVPKKTLKFIEFGTYFSFLHRYYSAVEKNNILEVSKQSMLSSCKYLLVQSQEKLQEYSSISGNKEIMYDYSKFCDEQFSLLKDIRYNDLSSVALAHTINHRDKKVSNVEGIVEKNYNIHLNNVELVIISKEKKDNHFMGNIAMCATIGGAIIGSSLYHNGLNSFEEPEFRKAILSTSMLIGMGYLMYNPKVLSHCSNYLKNIIKKT